VSAAGLRKIDKVGIDAVLAELRAKRKTEAKSQAK
jgi:ribosomal protein L28